MKIITMYLPQYHRVKENDEWWGEGFTDWDAVRKARSLFDGHEQPNEPLNDDYYDLMDKKTMQWQADLMHRYGVYGQCIYHYWFKDGRRILEKPAENLMKWTDIDMPFCFCWANETWARSWSAISDKNTWADTFEKGCHHGNGILLEQYYGHQKEWRQHFEYLLPFFKDKRYIKVDNKPVFLIYKTKDIECLPEMIDCWNREAVSNGFDGIYIIGANSLDSQCCILDGVLFHEPQRGMYLNPADIKKVENGIHIYDYDAVWNTILKEYGKGKVYYEGFVNYDDTPRRGDHNGRVIKGSADKFGYYIRDLINKNANAGNDFTFINAWNEWGESMYLEPDKQNSYSYLEALQKASNTYLDIDTDYSICGQNRDITSDHLNFEKSDYYMRRFSDWMTVRDMHINIGEYLRKKGIENVAVYGIGQLGTHLIRELVDSEIRVKYIIDKSASTDFGIKVIRPDDQFESVDLIIVAASYYYSEIYGLIRKKYSGEICSLASLIQDILMEINHC